MTTIEEEYFRPLIESCDLVETRKNNKWVTK